MKSYLSGLIAIIIALGVVFIPNNVVAASFNFPSIFRFSRPTPPSFPETPKFEKIDTNNNSEIKVSISTSASPSQSPSVTAKPNVAKSPLVKSSTAVKSKTTDANLSVKAFIMGKINEYRKSLGLSAVSTDTYTCAFAAVRAKEIAASFSHDGFKDRINAKTLPYPGYKKVTENLAMNSNYKEVVNKWIASPGHAENMRADTPFVCVEQFGNYYAYEGWKP